MGAMWGRDGAVLVALVGLGVIAVMSTLAAQGTASQPLPVVTAAEPGAVRAAASPAEALGQFVATTGNPFAGACQGTRSPQDAGQICTRFVAERGQDGMQAYLIGRTFSEFSTWVFVAPTAGRWAVVAQVPLDFTSMSLTVPWP